MKGLVISNCGAMGLDWAGLSMSGYLEAMNARGGEGKPEAKASPELKRFLTAHGAMGNA